MIPLGRNGFTDPKTGAEFVWPVNHSEEAEGGGRTRAVTTLQPTAAPWVDVRPIRQSGTTSADKLSLSGSVFTEKHHRRMVEFERITKTRTIIFTHADGSRAEVILTRYEPTRVRVMRGPRGGTRIWRYSLDMEIINRL